MTLKRLRGGAALELPLELELEGPVQLARCVRRSETTQYGACSCTGTSLARPTVPPPALPTLLCSAAGLWRASKQAGRQVQPTMQRNSAMPIP